MFTEICNKFFYFVFPTSLLLSKKWELEASPTTPGCFPLLCSLFLKLVTKGWFFSVWRLLGKFLGEGNKVKAVVRFRGREMSHMELGREVIAKFEEALKGVGAAEKKPVLDGRFMSIVLAPVKPEKK